MGVLRFTPAAWQEIATIREALTQDQQDRMHMTGTLQMVIDSDKIPVHAIAYEGQWGEVDSQVDLQAYQDEN